MQRRYDVVFLDAQGTLITAHPSTAAVYGEVCARLGYQIGHKEIASAIRALWAETRLLTDTQAAFDTSDEATKAWWKTFNSKLFHRLGMKNGLERFVDEMWMTFGRPETYRPYPEALDVLLELKKRSYRLGIVSNWDSRLPSICETHGISGHVDFIVASAAVGVEKPDRRIFEIALDRAGVPPHRAIHIGDDYEADVLGARGAGIEALHLDRDGTGPSDKQKIPSLRELLNLLP
ncbi:MAG: HAD-IA family hydrolase [Chloroflexota bacterium]|jgi:putative hydrolase of the HAD superfamily